MKKSIVRLNSLWINYHEYGEPSSTNPPLICLHGVTGNAWLWDRVARNLAVDRQVFVIDFRGHGDSEWSKAHAYSSDDHVADLLAFIEHAKLAEVDIAGMSWGALVAIKASSALATRLKRLIVIDVEASFAQSASDVAPRPNTFESVAAVIEWEKKANPSAPEDVLEPFAYYSVQQNATGAFERKHDPYFFTQWPFRNDDLWSALGELNTATLFIHGERSFVKKAVMQEMLDHTPGGVKLIDINDSGHLVAFEQPTALTEAIQDFLSS